MLFSYHTLDDDEKRAIELIEKLRYDLRYFVAQDPKRWTGLLARMTRARVLRASNSIEGINVSQEDAIAAVDGEDPAEADKATWQAALGYQSAMTYILHRCRDRNFTFSRDSVLAMHFMISQHDLDANPGNFRRGWVGVRNTEDGVIVHEGVDREDLEPLMDELIAYLNDNTILPVELKAAIAHLNLTMLHPFSDGNGRTARCLQTAVLANQGIVAPEFSSIEEYVGANQQAYYDVLAETGGGKWSPARSCKPWVRFCLTGHYRQLQTLLRRNAEYGQIYGDLIVLIQKHGLPERAALGLLEAALGGRIRNASYRVTTDVSNNLASRDLKQLVDAKLLFPKGEKRGRHYIASDEIRQIRAARRMPKIGDDPFAHPAPSSQGQLF